MPALKHKRLALITGASRGLGRAVALAMARCGIHVLLMARNVPDLEKVDDHIKQEGGTATLVPLDVQDGEGMHRLTHDIHARWGKLDILVGNAGRLGPLTPLSQVSIPSWQKIMETNLNANFYLISAMAPLLAKSKAGRAVFVTSGVAQNPRAYWGPYATSKAALEALVMTWAKENIKTSLRINMINPGPTRTAMRATAMPGEDPNSLPTPEDIAPLFLTLTHEECEHHGAIFKFEKGKPI